GLEDETTELYQAIRAKRFRPPPSHAPDPTPPTIIARPTRAPPATRPALPLPALPLHTTEFVGRAREVAHICRLLTQETNCRLLTLVGPSGIGKTRLALEVAQQILASAGDDAEDKAGNDASIAPQAGRGPSCFADGII